MRTRLTCFDIALNAVELGLSTIPPKEDGSKAPLAEWKPYQHTAPSRQLVENWYGRGRSGVGLVTGYAALECFEFDCGVNLPALPRNRDSDRPRRPGGQDPGRV
jgi:hypothetical protein